MTSTQKSKEKKKRADCLPQESVGTLEGGRLRQAVGSGSYTENQRSPGPLALGQDKAGCEPPLQVQEGPGPRGFAES